MPKKKIIRAEDIREKDILSLYEGVLPLLFNNPKDIDIPQQLRNAVLRFVQFDSYEYLMEDPNPRLSDDKFSRMFEKKNKTGDNIHFSSISVQPLKNNNIDKAFEDQMEERYKTKIQGVMKLHPDKSLCYNYKIVSLEHPKVMIRFFRFCKADEHRVFTKDEKLIFEKLTPHLQSLFRVILSPMFKSSPFQYFDKYLDICSVIVRDHNLSDTESKFLPEILFGLSNEEIAEKNFISVAAVKKHIKHIFKKTETKNRINFISKFFTSPNRIPL